MRLIRYRKLHDPVEIVDGIHVKFWRIALKDDKIKKIQVRTARKKSTGKKMYCKCKDANAHDILALVFLDEPYSIEYFPTL